MKLKFGLIVLSIIIAANCVSAQSNILSGTIKDKVSNQPLPGVNIYLPEIKRGTITDERGVYSISVPSKTENVLLQVSMIGYKTEVIRVNPDNFNTALNFSLTETGILANEVIISAGRISTREDIPVQVEMISAKDMRTDGEVNIMSSMTRIPGVEQISYGNSIGKPVIRGMSFSRILTMYQRSRFENQQWGADHGLGMNDLGVESVEIIKGPASFLYGSGAIGGVVYLVDERNAPVGTSVGDVNTTFFSNTLGLRQTLGFRETKESGWFYGVNAALETHADYTDGNNRTIGNSRFNTRTFRANTGVQKDWGSVRLGYTYHRQNLGIIEDDELEETLATTRNDRALQLPFQEVDDHLLTLTSMVNVGKGRIEANLGYHLNNRLEIEDDFDEVDLGLRQRNLTYDLKYIFSSNTSLEHVIGTQGFNLTNENMAEAEEILIPDATLLDGSLYYLATIKRDKSTWQAGVRYDARRTTGDASAPLFLQYGYSLPGITDSRTHTTNHQGFSGSVGGTFQLSEQFNMKANLSSGFRAPDLAELFSNGEHPGTQRFEVGNVNFEREQNIQLDLAFQYKREHFTMEFTPFYNYISNYIYFTPTGRELDGTDLIIWEFGQDNARLTGFELATIWHPFNNNTWTIDSRYSMVRGVNPDTDEFMPLMPADRWITSLRYQMRDKGKFKRNYMGISYNYVFEQNRLGVRELEALSGGLTPSFNLVGLSAGTSFTLGKQIFNLDVTATNLLNEAYVDHMSFLRPFDILNLGRNISVNLNVPLNF